MSSVSRYQVIFGKSTSGFLQWASAEVRANYVQNGYSHSYQGVGNTPREAMQEAIDMANAIGGWGTDAITNVGSASQNACAYCPYHYLTNQNTRDDCETCENTFYCELFVG